MLDDASEDSIPRRALDAWFAEQDSANEKVGDLCTVASRAHCLYQSASGLVGILSLAARSVAPMMRSKQKLNRPQTTRLMSSSSSTAADGAAVGDGDVERDSEIDADGDGEAEGENETSLHPPFPSNKRRTSQNKAHCGPSCDYFSLLL